MQTIIAGIVRFTFDQLAQNLNVSVQPAQMPITVEKSEIQFATVQLLQPHLGPSVKHTDEESNKSEKKQAKESEKEKIAKRQQLEEIKEKNDYVGENATTGEKIHQKRFKKLKKPFKYQSEETGNPEGTKKSNIPPAPKKEEASPVIPPVLGGTRSVEPQTNIENAIQLDKQQYYVGETITGRYPNVKNRNLEQIYMVRVTDGCSVRNAGPNTFLIGKDGKFSYKPATCGGYADIKLQLWTATTSQGEPVGSIKMFRIRPHVRMVPSALSVIAGSTHGEPVTAVVTPPGSEKFLFSNTTVKEVRWILTLYRLGSPLLGGRNIPDHLLKKWSLQSSGTQQIDVTNALNYALPALYELRLETLGYIISRKRFSRVPRPMPGSLMIEGTHTPKAGERISFRYTGGLVPNTIQWPLSVSLFRFGPNGRLFHVVRRPVNKKTNKTLSYRLMNSGSYVARLHYGHCREWEILLDSLTFEVLPKRDPHWPRLVQTNNQKTFFTGENIPVFIQAKNLFEKLNPKTPGMEAESVEDLSLVLYPEKRINKAFDAMPERDVAAKVKSNKIKEYGELQQNISESIRKGATEAAVEILRHRMYELAGEIMKMKVLPEESYKTPLRITPDPLSPKPLRSWPIELGKDQTLLIQEKLLPGRYRLILEGLVNDYPRKIFNRPISIFPRFNMNSIDLDGRDLFEIGEIFEVSLPALPGPFTYELQLAGDGGFLPGCTYALPPFPRTVQLAGNERIVKLQAPRIPGTYFLRLQPSQGTRVLVEKIIKVIASPDPVNLVTLDKTFYMPSEKMQVRINPEAAIYIPNIFGDPRREDTIDTGLTWSVEYMGHFAVGGASSVLWPNITLHGWQGHCHHKLQAVINAPQNPGVYAIVVRAREIQELGVPVSLRLFSVGYPEFSPPDQGPNGVKPPLPFPDRDYPFPPWGAYLDRGNCSMQLERQPEDMDLRFVCWSDGKYLPVEGDLEFGQSFYIEGKLEKEASSDFYIAEITDPSGRVQEVVLTLDANDSTVVRSERLYCIWEPEEF